MSHKSPLALMISDYSLLQDLKARAELERLNMVKNEALCKPKGSVKNSHF